MKKKEDKIDFKSSETLKDVYKLVRMKKNEKFILITSILEEVEDSYDIVLEEFQFKDKRLSIRVGKNDWICVDLSKDL